MASDAVDTSHLSLLEDINAHGSDALTALEENRLADVRTNLRGLLDAVREAIDAIEREPPDLGSTRLFPATGATKMPAATKPVRAPDYRTFAVAQIEEASNQQCGFCFACGAMQENCEPDARKYRCDDCRQNEVYGAEELVLMGLMR
jgi:hypothetical protein